MAWQFTPYAVPLTAVALVLAGLALAGWRHRSAPGALAFTGLVAALFGWIVASLFQLSASGLDAKLRWFETASAFSLLVPPLLVGFALAYTGHRPITRRLVALLALEPAVFVADLLANGAGGNLLVRTATLTTAAPTVFGVRSAPFAVLETTPGIGPAVHLPYSYLLLAYAGFLIVRTAVRSRHVYERQALALVVGVAVPFVASVVEALGASPFESVSTLPVAFAATGVAFSFAVFRYRALDLVPVARDTVLEEMRDGVVVLDAENRIVDANTEGRRLLDDETGSVVGRPFGEALSPGGDLTPPNALESVASDSETADRNSGSEGFRGERSVEVGGETRFFDVRVSSLYDRRDRRSGCVVLFHDITERKRREWELARRNDQLDEFASVVSHDLRNPLSVAGGFLEVAEETGDPEHFERVDDALDRMDRIIDDVLALARGSDAVTDPETVALDTLFAEAWATVDAPDADLAVDFEGMVLADRERLRRAIENLLRNAVDHGDGRVTVRVGRLDERAPSNGERADADIGIESETGSSGFYVADDGPGIPPENRERVFERGYTTDAEGTGFGLSIVAELLAAHGWAITATESETGGARFEVTGMRFVRPAENDALAGEA